MAKKAADKQAEPAAAAGAAASSSTTTTLPKLEDLLWMRDKVSPNLPNLCP